MGDRRGIFWLVVAAYLCYLGIKLIKDCVAPGPTTELADNPALFIAFGVVFLVIAAIFVVSAIKNFKKVSEEKALAEAEEAEREAEEAANAPHIEEASEETQEPEADGPMSIADRIKLLSADDEEAEAEADTEAEETEADAEADKTEE